MRRYPLLALAGGVGIAKLAIGLARILPPEALTIVVNTGDDEVFWGLHVSPDLDTVMYTLAGEVNPDTWWGLRDDTFHVLEALGRLGVETWFRLGDWDLATHIRRTELLRAGCPLTRVTQDLCRRFGVSHAIVPTVPLPRLPLHVGPSCCGLSYQGDPPFPTEAEHSRHLRGKYPPGSHPGIILFRPRSFGPLETDSGEWKEIPI